MFEEDHKLEAGNDDIRFVFDSKQIDLHDKSFVEIFYTVDDDDELSEINLTDAIVEINKIKGSLLIGDSSNGIEINFQIDKFNTEWKIKCSEYLYRNSGVVYPHEIDINIDKKELYIKFDNIQ